MVPTISLLGAKPLSPQRLQTLDRSLRDLTMSSTSSASISSSSISSSASSSAYSASSSASSTSSALPSIPSSSGIITARHTSQEAMSPSNKLVLLNLPNELLYQVATACDLWSLTNLRQTNHLFKEICNSQALFDKAKGSLVDSVALLFYAAIRKEGPLVLKLLENLGPFEIDFVRGPGQFQGPPRATLKRYSAELKLPYVLHNASTILIAHKQKAQVYTALAWAAEHTIIPFMKFLLKRDPRCVNYKDSLGRTPLLMAIRRGEESWAETLLSEYGADPNAHGLSILHDALKNRTLSLDFVRMLISKGAVLDYRIWIGGKCWTPLHTAASYRDETAVELLLSYGVNVDPYQGNAGSSSTPLHLAALRTDAGSIVKALIEAGADYTLVNEKGMSVFSCLEKSGNPAMAYLLTKMYMNRERTPNKHSYTRLALQYGALDILSDRIRNRENFEIEDADGHRPLYIAIKYHQIGAVELLFDAGADHSYLMGKHGTSLLHFAATSPDLVFYRALLNKGSTYAFTHDRNKQSAISIAANSEVRSKYLNKNGISRVGGGAREGVTEADVMLRKMVSEKEGELTAEALGIGRRLGVVWDVAHEYSWEEPDVGDSNKEEELSVCDDLVAWYTGDLMSFRAWEARGSSPMYT